MIQVKSFRFFGCDQSIVSSLLKVTEGCSTNSFFFLGRLFGAFADFVCLIEQFIAIMEATLLRLVGVLLLLEMGYYYGCAGRRPQGSRRSGQGRQAGRAAGRQGGRQGSSAAPALGRAPGDRPERS